MSSVDYHALAKKYKNMRIDSGRGRLLLFAMAQRIEEEKEFTPEEIKAGAKHPRPKNPIERALYEFLLNCQTGEIAYVKELLDRMDGKAIQAVNLGDADGEKLAVNIVRFSDLPLVGEGSTIASQSPKRLDS